MERMTHKSRMLRQGLHRVLILAWLACAGCETSPPVVPSIPQTGGEQTQAAELPPPSVPTGFGPAKITVLPLSEITFPAGQDARLHAYAALLDAFGCSIKAPCSLRFEVYEYLPRSAQAKGPRVKIWPDVDLTRPAENHKSWRDFLRAYEFQLPLRADRDKTYILEVTCLGASGKRLSCESAIRSGR